MRNEADPYLCFRRRESKPIRKTRRSDQQSIEKLRKLRIEMEGARSLLEMVSRREKMRKESMVLEHLVFEQKCKLREYKRVLGVKDDDDDYPHSKKKGKRSNDGSATIRISLNSRDRDSSLTSEDFNRKDRSTSHSGIEDDGWEDCTDVSIYIYSALHPYSLIV
jgi:hypothetical protein